MDHGIIFNRRLISNVKMKKKVKKLCVKKCVCPEKKFLQKQHNIDGIQNANMKILSEYVIFCILLSLWKHWYICEFDICLLFYFVYFVYFVRERSVIKK